MNIFEIKPLKTTLNEVTLKTNQLQNLFLKLCKRINLKSGTSVVTRKNIDTIFLKDHYNNQPRFVLNLVLFKVRVQL